jgi:small-conductance mechanosensitive channel
MSLIQLNTIRKQHENLITDDCREQKDVVLDLRRQLLSKLAKDGSVRVDMLSKLMVKFQKLRNSSARTM